MERKVYVNVTVKLILNIEEGEKISDVMGEMEHNFEIQNENVDIVDSEITLWTVTDSK